jgi:Xaa-Pro aminopeptidase
MPQAAPALAALPAGSVLLVDPRRVTFGLRQACRRRVHAWSRPSTRARWPRAARPPPRRRFVREAMAEDGAAMCEFYAWFEAALARGERWTEMTVDERLSADAPGAPASSA